MHLEADVLAGPEGPADPTEHEADLVVGEAEARRDLAAVLVEPLSRDVEFDAVAARDREYAIAASSPRNAWSCIPIS